MRLVYLVCFIALVAGIALPANAKFEVMTEPFFGPQHPWDAYEKTWCSDFSTDAFTLRATDDGKLLDSIKYCAAYGHTNVRGFTDKAGRHYVLIERGTMHGTHATFYDLDIYRVVPGQSSKIMTIPVEEPSWECHEVRYEYTLSDTQAGGLELTLHQQLHQDSPDCDPKHAPLPLDALRVVRIDVPK